MKANEFIKTGKGYTAPSSTVMLFVTESICVGSREGLGDLDNPPTWEQED